LSILFFFLSHDHKMSSVPPPGMVEKPVTTKPEKGFEEPADANIPDNYVSWTLKNQKALPPVRWDNLLQELNWLNVSILTIPPLLAIYGLSNVRLRWETALFAVFYYFVTGLGTLLQPRHCIPPLIHMQASLLVTTVFGPTGHIMPPSHSSTPLHLQVPELSKVPLNGGLVVTAHTTVTPTPTWIPITPTKDSGTRISVGCSSSLAENPVSLILVI
jgi:hypothetical protein